MVYFDIYGLIRVTENVGAPKVCPVPSSGVSSSGSPSIHYTALFYTALCFSTRTVVWCMVVPAP